MAQDVADIEAALIGAVLASPAEMAAAAIRRGVKAEWFEAECWEATWTAVAAMFGDGRIATADAVTILNETRRILGTEAGQKKWPGARVSAEDYQRAIDRGAYDVAGLARDLREVAMARAVRGAMNAAHVALGNTSPEVVIGELRRSLDSILAGAVNGKRVDAAAVYDSILADYREAHKMRVDPDGPRDLTWCPGYKFPWAPMTAMMNGLEPGLGVIAARPSVGKTLFALNLIRYWCDCGLHVVFNSLDMANKSLMRRFVAERARVSIAKAKFSPTRGDLAAMERAVGDCKAMPLTQVEIDDVDEFRTFVQIEKSAGRCDIVVVDYLGLMHTRAVRAGDEYATVSYVSDCLKGLANHFELPVVALAQLNRDSAKGDVIREPGLVDLRGSGKVEQDAYWVMFLHREEGVVNGSWRDNPPVQLVAPPASAGALAGLDSVFAILCKSQNGALGRLPFVFRKNYLSAHLGDWRAAPSKKTTGFGATARVGYDYTANFSKVCSDWRRDPIEDVLARQGALIRLDAAAVPMAADNASAPAALGTAEETADASADEEDPYYDD